MLMPISIFFAFLMVIQEHAGHGDRARMFFVVVQFADNVHERALGMFPIPCMALPVVFAIFFLQNLSWRR